MHNERVPQQADVITQFTHTATELWRSQFRQLDSRGIRKVILAAMFTTIALIYIGQLAMQGISTPITPDGPQFTTTLLSSLAAAVAGGIYLWRVNIPQSLEITILAIVLAISVQKPLMPAVYSMDTTGEGELWIVFAYVAFFISLSVAYLLSYIFFAGWRIQHRDKLVIAVIVVTMLLIVQASTNAGAAL